MVIFLSFLDTIMICIDFHMLFVFKIWDFRTYILFSQVGNKSYEVCLTDWAKPPPPEECECPASVPVTVCGGWLGDIFIKEFLVRNAIQFFFVISRHDVPHLIADCLIESSSAFVGRWRIHIDAARAASAGKALCL